MNLRVVVFEERGRWIGQCIERDICVSAESVDELRERLALTIEAEKVVTMQMNGSPFAGILPAPQRFFDLWDKQGGWSLAA